MDMDVENFGALKDAIKLKLGFDCAFYTDSFLQRRVEVRMRVLKSTSYKDYQKLLCTLSSESELLRKELTIHTTNFFRDYSMWVLFQNEIIPLVIKNKQKQTATSSSSNGNMGSSGIVDQDSSKTIRVWCIGCSTGEEPLSVAICFFESLGKGLKGFQLSILATDLDSETIRNANDAKYDPIQFKEMPADIKARYFIEKDGYFSPVSQIKDVISYRQNDIFLPNKPKGFDIILCRNTVIYFDQAPKLRIYEELYECLQTGGFFVMGKTETMMGPARDRFIQFSLKERIFCKESHKPQSQDELWR